MKAIHNISAASLIKTETVFNISKIQNESNSQLPGEPSIYPPDCV